jgi:hypothetical protein
MTNERISSAPKVIYILDSLPFVRLFPPQHNNFHFTPTEAFVQGLSRRHPTLPSETSPSSPCHSNGMDMSFSPTFLSFCVCVLRRLSLKIRYRFERKIKFKVWVTRCGVGRCFSVEEGGKSSSASARFTRVRFSTGA